MSVIGISHYFLNLLGRRQTVGRSARVKAHPLIDARGGSIFGDLISHQYHATTTMKTAPMVLSHYGRSYAFHGSDCKILAGYIHSEWEASRSKMIQDQISNLSLGGFYEK